MPPLLLPVPPPPAVERASQSQLREQFMRFAKDGMPTCALCHRQFAAWPPFLNHHRTNSCTAIDHVGPASTDSQVPSAASACSAVPPSPDPQSRPWFLVPRMLLLLQVPLIRFSRGLIYVPWPPRMTHQVVGKAGIKGWLTRSRATRATRAALRTTRGHRRRQAPRCVMQDRQGKDIEGIF